MAIFTAIAAYVVAAIGITGTAATIFTAIGATILSVGASRLLMKRQMEKGSGGGGGGSRIQLPPATENKLPVVYGSAYIGGSVTDAKISQNNKTMWYVVAMAEVTDTGAYTFDTNNIYYNGLKVNFGANGVVTGLVNNTTPATTDTKMSGQINIYLFPNGSSDGVTPLPGQNTAQTAIQIMQDSQIPAGQQWTSTDLMTKCAFAIIKVQYNAEKGTTSLGGLTARITNSLTKPGSVIKDYMTNARYGCAIPLAQVDTASLTALDTYSDQTITYNGGLQNRYRIDGPLATGNNCLSNLQILADSCDSWVQYSEFLGQWRMIVNQSYTDYTTIGNLFLVDSSNLVGGINVSPINLNETFNQLEVAYPNESIRDQTDYQLIKLEDWAPEVMSPNEALNKLDVDFPVVNNSIQSQYLGVRRLLQSREDLTVSFQLDYSGIQVEAGDVIRVKQEVYGWDTLNSGEGKLFRVANVAEEKYSDGSLGARITAFEYNDSIYADFALDAFNPDPNTGIANPNIMDTPVAPRLFLDQNTAISSLQIKAIVPDAGLFTNLNVNYGSTSNTNTHIFYSGTNNSGGDPLTAKVDPGNLVIGEEYSINTFGTTDFTTVGANKVYLSTSPLPGGFLKNNTQYIIDTVGTTDWTVCGALTNTQGEIFTANNIGTGTGIALETDFVATGTTTGNGTVDTLFTFHMTDLLDGQYYWSTTARNQTQGVTGPASNVITWDGPSTSTFQQFEINNAYSTGNVIDFSPANDNLIPGGTLQLIATDSGELLANTYINQINSNVQFEMNQSPSSVISNGVMTITGTYSNVTLGGGAESNNAVGGVKGNDIAKNAIGYDQVNASAFGRLLARYSYSISELLPLPSGTTNTPVDWNTTMGTQGSLLSTNFDTPKYITSDSSTLSSSSYLNPWWNGVASTANGYYESSTAPWTPGRSAIWSRGSNENLGGGAFPIWPVDFALMQLDGRGFLAVPGNVISIEWAVTVVASQDCTIQYGSFTHFSTDANWECTSRDDSDTVLLQLYANVPTYIDYETTTQSIGGLVDGFGVWMRILTPSTTVTIAQGGFSLVDVKDT